MRPGLRGQLILGMLGAGLLVFAGVVVLTMGIMDAGRMLAARSVADAEATIVAAALRSDGTDESPCAVARRLGLETRVVHGSPGSPTCDGGSVPGRLVEVEGEDEVAIVIEALALPREWAALRKVLVAYLTLSLLLSLLVGGVLLTRWVTRPVERIARAAQRVTAGQAGARVPVEGRGEVRELARRFNEMLDRLDTVRADLESRAVELTESNIALRAARREAMRAEHLAAVGRLAAGLAHELGNPIAAVRGMLRLVEESVEGAEERDLLERSTRELSRMEDLLRSLLTYARPPSLRLQEVDAATVAADALSLVRHDERCRGRELAIRKSDEPRLVLACPDGLRQVLLNLILNACEATGAGGAIGVDIEAVGDQLRLEIEDDGEGMTDEVLEAALDPFFTTREPGRGTGLGLPLSERLVEQMGGRLEIHSSPGEGTRVRVMLPLVAESAHSGAPSGK